MRGEKAAPFFNSGRFPAPLFTPISLWSPQIVSSLNRLLRGMAYAKGEGEEAVRGEKRLLLQFWALSHPPPSFKSSPIRLFAIGGVSHGLDATH